MRKSVAVVVVGFVFLFSILFAFVFVYGSTRKEGIENGMSAMSRDGSGLFEASAIDESDYQCTGTCYCESESRRAAALTMTKGVSVVIAAVSVYYAMNVAKDYGSRECFDLYEDECNHEDIRFELDECEPGMFAKKDSKVAPDTVPKNLVGEKPVTKVDEGKYFCKGYCLPNPQAFRAIEMKEENLKKYLGSFCGRMTVNGYFTVSSQVDLAEGFKELNTMTPTAARTFYFARTQLDQFCRQSSKKLLKNTGRKKTKKKFWKNKKARDGGILSACVGVSVTPEGNVYQNSKNKCSPARWYHSITKWL